MQFLFMISCYHPVDLSSRFRCFDKSKCSPSILHKNTECHARGWRAKHIQYFHPSKLRYFDISKLRYFDISKLSIRYPTLIHISWKIYNGWDPNIQWLGCSLSMQWLKLEWLRSSPSIGCLRFTQFSVGLENIPVTIIMKPTNSSTQGQPNPRKIRLKVACGPLFPTANIISWVGIGLDREQTYKKINPTKFSANTIVINNG